MLERAHARAATALIVAAAGSCAYAGCYAPTQIELRLSSDVACNALEGTGGAEIEMSTSADALANEQPSATAAHCLGPAESGTASSLGTLVLVPRSGRGDRVVVQVVLRLPERATPCRPPLDVTGCIVARRSVRFVEHRSLRVPITLDGRCAGVKCGVDETCDVGRCVGADVGDCSGDCAPGLGPGGPVASVDASTDGPGLDGSLASDGPAVDASDAASKADACPPQVPLACDASCGKGVRCCVIDNVNYGCGAACDTAGADHVCTDDCQCAPQACKAAPSCKGLKLCGGTCASPM
jgi:hypothetical protein